MGFMVRNKTEASSTVRVQVAQSSHLKEATDTATYTRPCATPRDLSPVSPEAVNHGVFFFFSSTLLLPGLGLSVSTFVTVVLSVLVSLSLGWSAVFYFQISIVKSHLIRHSLQAILLNVPPVPALGRFGKAKRPIQPLQPSCFGSYVDGS